MSTQPKGGGQCCGRSHLRHVKSERQAAVHCPAYGREHAIEQGSGRLGAACGIFGEAQRRVGHPCMHTHVNTDCERGGVVRVRCELIDLPQPSQKGKAGIGGTMRTMSSHGLPSVREHRHQSHACACPCTLLLVAQIVCHMPSAQRPRIPSRAPAMCLARQWAELHTLRLLESEGQRPHSQGAPKCSGRFECDEAFACVCEHGIYGFVPVKSQFGTRLHRCTMRWHIVI